MTFEISKCLVLDLFGPFQKQFFAKFLIVKKCAYLFRSNYVTKRNRELTLVTFLCNQADPGTDIFRHAPTPACNKILILICQSLKILSFTHFCAHTFCIYFLENLYSVASAIFCAIFI